MQPRSALLLLLLTSGVALAWRKEAPPAAPVAAEPRPASLSPEPRPAEPPPAHPSRPVPPPDEFLGVILARVSADIAPRFEGRLREVHVRLGDHLVAGQLIGTLDVPSLRFDLRRAEAELAAAEVDESRAEIELAEAQERLRRRRALADQALASGEDLATTRYQEQIAATRLGSARAQIAERRAQVDRLRHDNTDARITAPFDGIVAARYLGPGESARPSTPVVRLISLRDPFVRFAVPERQARAMVVGQAVRVRVGEPHLELEGIIETVAPEIDAASHHVLVEAGLGPFDPELRVLSGGVARVSLAEPP
ncbi:efflux RND transporter periplasmic adaptor subunit [Sorangium sp. So ce388]|uniref:efflux RND transporter periplasmic adaptor subunit n=1 Tax=Sorangium sp. So ce388 TaxID=3133309 RepID=UPI003F5B96A6